MQSVAELIMVVAMTLVTPKATIERALLFNKSTSGWKKFCNVDT